MTDNRLILRASLKLLSAIALLWLAYVFFAGLLTGSDRSNRQFTFDLSSLQDNQAAYFKTDTRKLLVIHKHNNFSVFWANDPVYGCQLEYNGNFIKPVCIDIQYTLDGYSIDRQQQLRSPDFELNEQQILLLQ